MWDIQVDLLPAANPIIQHANRIVMNKATKPDIVRYHHSSLDNTTLNKLFKGIKQVFLATLPGLDEKLVTKHLPPSIDTAKGHLQQEHQGLKPIKLQPATKREDLYTLEGPTRTNLFTADIVKATTIKAYGDLIGQYQTMSSIGNQYILVIYYYYFNAIIRDPVKIFQKGNVLNGYQNVHKHFSCNGYKTQIKTLDNK